jgi:hypothetical protein
LGRFAFLTVRTLAEVTIGAIGLTRRHKSLAD